MQEYGQALADYERAIELDPNYALAYGNIGALFGIQGKLEKALHYFEQAAQLGDPTSAQYAAVIRKSLGMEPAPSADPAQQAFDAFRQAASPEAMREAAIHFPLLLEAEFIATIEQVIAQQVPPDQRQPFQQRLAWLRQIADERKDRG